MSILVGQEDSNTLSMGLTIAVNFKQSMKHNEIRGKCSTHDKFKKLILKKKTFIRNNRK